ncbi:histidinol dehydrogenase [Fulvivirgaceae bacterium BMA10]|uniref:Histidinol dehydrogenase n=1 Tax=Splendidivirga corallicola TaxID=3051826 RepID=A0ABT8KQB4_9BACT|nr:histidinol dehydrogenase [Fulvivirgaceae bacterium BMA10]
MKIFKYPDKNLWPEILKRPSKDFSELESIVQEVFEQIKNEGDKALLNFTKKFDGVNLQEIEVSKEEIENAERLVSEQLKAAIQLAKNNIRKFHSSQAIKEEEIETIEGVRCWRKAVPIDKVGLYIPGGTAPLFSTVLMLGIPAKIAGCKEIILCTPPNVNGEIHPAILYTASLIGINKIYKLGGTQAIGAMHLGTECVPKVYKIFGPGNQYVTAAKQVANKFGTAIDMPAGPSEVLIVADQTANPAYVAADLLSQAEHGADSQVLLITYHEKLIEEVEKELSKQLEVLPRRDIANEALENSRTILVKDQEEALEIINEYAPEHLIVSNEDENFFVEHVKNAGSVFLGNYTPESAGDYASGTNHTLPTNGFAKAYSGVSLDSFLKKITFQRISEQGISKLGPAIEVMAEAEELMAHKNAVSIRLKDLNF